MPCGRAAAAIIIATLAASSARATPCLPAVARGAWQYCAFDGGSIRTHSYFERHAARVEGDLLRFHRAHTLESMRARDQWLRFGSVGGTGAALTGANLFSGAVVTSAHGPRQLRLLHLGPAIFEGGGMGVGFGGKL
jgi:hypothetical protein